MEAISRKIKTAKVENSENPQETIEEKKVIQPKIDSFFKKSPQKEKLVEKNNIIIINNSNNNNNKINNQNNTKSVEQIQDNIKSLLIFPDDFSQSKFGKFSISNWESHFLEMAKQIMDNYVISVTNPKTKEIIEYRLREIEFYYNHPKYHPDVFTHSMKEQQIPGQWYFHRDNFNRSKWRTGNYKGLDFTFGSKGTEDHGGVLIRCIERLKDKKIFEGPCIAVRELLTNFGKTEIHELMEDTSLNFTLSTCFSDNKWMSLKQRKNEIIKDFFTSPRVGLSMKTKFEKHNPFQFLMRNHRFLNIKPSKGKIYLLSNLIHTNFQNLETFGNSKTFEGIKKNIEKGKTMTEKNFYGKKAEGDTEIAILFGFTKTKEK